MNHYCTYFNRAYLAAGVALWRSLQRHDPGMVLWVLALDDETAAALRGLARDDAKLRVLTAAEIEAADPELARSRATRPWLEHLFTFSPCLPRHVLRNHSEVAAITYVDADLYFFADAAPLSAEWANGSVYVVRHDLPPYLAAREERFGRFNVGVLGFRNDANGRACLDWWRERCLEWCKDAPEPGRYADQKYLDEWPARFPGVVVSEHPGVNAAPWNWETRRLRVVGGRLRAGESLLVVFHFAQLRRLGPRRIETSQSEFGVMPFRLRGPLYGAYVDALDAAERELAAVGHSAPSGERFRSRRGGWRGALIAWVFGTTWTRVGAFWWSWGFGLGRHSGRILAWWRRRQGRAA